MIGDVVLKVIAGIALAFAVLTPTHLNVPAGPPPPVAPDTSRIISVLGPSVMGHACPVTINSAMTAGHVTADTLESGEQVKHYYRGESGSWEGFLDWKLTSTYEDAGVLAREESSAPFVPYELALRRPAVGEQLWWMGYDWRTGPAALDRRIFTGKVQSVRAGSIVLDVPTPQGSSGSCVLDSSGKVVGVISWGIEQADGKEVAIAVGLFPPYFNGLSKE